MTTETSYTLTQLAQIVSALEDQRRNPNSKATALRAIERNAAQIGLSAQDVLDAADGLLSGRLSAAEWRAQLCGEPAAESVENPEAGAEAAADADRTDGDSSAAVKMAPEANGGNSEPSVVCHEAGSLQLSPTVERGPTVKQQLLAACQRAAKVLHGYEIEADTLQMLRAAIARAEGPTRRATTGESAKSPRSDSKQARLIAMLQRGASISEMASELGWLRHTCHGALAGLKKKRGLQIISDKHADGERIYRLAAAAETSATAD